MGTFPWAGGPREAEALIDLLEQIQGALWDTYGHAILDRAADGEPSIADGPAWHSDPNDDPTF